MSLRAALMTPALALALAFAGCTDPGAGGSEAPAATSAPASSSADTMPPSPASPTVRATDLPFAVDGRTWTTACVVVPPVVGQCQHVAEGSALTEPLPAGEPVLRFRGTLAWSEGNTVVGIGVVTGEGQDVAMVEGAYAEGPSPLAFDFDLSAAANQTLGFHVASYANVGAGPANAGVSPGQDWSLDGTLTVLRAA